MATREKGVRRRAAILAALAPAAHWTYLRIRVAALAVAAWLVIAALGAQSASALATGSFSATGSMTEGRAGAVAAPLPDGRVLVAGGTYYDGFLNCPDLYCPQIHITRQSAEIFDPATASFSPTGSMTVPRTGAVAAPLPDGRVLVAGGTNDDGGGSVDQTLRSAEIFDPATGSFSPTGAMTEARTGAAAAPLPDGRVLVAGGGHYDGSSFVAQDSAEIFDPATGSFSSTGWRMTVPRAGAAAAPLPGGRVLVAGGGPYEPEGAEIFDPATGSFSSTGSMSIPRRAPVAAPLPDGRVLLAGSGPDDRSAEIFDPATGSFSPFMEFLKPDGPWIVALWSTTEGRSGAAAAPLPDGRVLLAGGFIFGVHSSSQRRSAELFTPALSRKLRGRKLIAAVAVAGTLTAADAKVNKRRRALKRTSARGGPGSITLKLRPTAKAKRRLERTGKLRVKARISFAPAPVRGRCVTLTGPCYSRGYAISETATLTLKAKRRR
jgi:Galactose oxidase, central domain